MIKQMGIKREDDSMRNDQAYHGLCPKVHPTFLLLDTLPISHFAVDGENWGHIGQKNKN
jgi:hypothetical protein